MNGIQVTKPSEQQWNSLLDVVVTILKYKKGIIYHDIRIKVFSAVAVSYIKVYTGDVINNTKNEAAFPELTRLFEEHFEAKYQKGTGIKYRNFRNIQSNIGFSVDHTDYIMELVNAFFQTGIYRTFDTTFRTHSTN